VHIANFLDVFEDKDCVYIIMELCSNNTMLELVKRKKRLTEAETRKFMIQIIEGASRCRRMHKHTPLQHKR
jgi:cell cycle serine/threonine-protein kinase CDC5/MSD2